MARRSSVQGTRAKDADTKRAGDTRSTTRLSRYENVGIKGLASLFNTSNVQPGIDVRRVEAAFLGEERPTTRAGRDPTAIFNQEIQQLSAELGVNLDTGASASVDEPETKGGGRSKGPGRAAVDDLSGLIDDLGLPGDLLSDTPEPAPKESPDRRPDSKSRRDSYSTDDNRRDRVEDKRRQTDDKRDRADDKRRQTDDKRDRTGDARGRTSGGSGRTDNRGARDSRRAGRVDDRRDRAPRETRDSRRESKRPKDDTKYGRDDDRPAPRRGDRSRRDYDDDYDDDDGEGDFEGDDGEGDFEGDEYDDGEGDYEGDEYDDDGEGDYEGDDDEGDDVDEYDVEDPDPDGIISKLERELNIRPPSQKREKMRLSSGRHSDRDAGRDREPDPVRHNIDSALNRLRGNSSTSASRGGARILGKRKDLISSIKNTRQALEEENVNTSAIPVPTDDMSDEEVEEIAQALKDRYNQNRAASLGEEVAMGAMEVLESVVDGSREYPLIGRPDLTGYHNTLMIKLHRNRLETGEIVSEIIRKHKISPLVRLAIELVPSMILHSKGRRRQANSPGLREEIMGGRTDNRAAFSTLRMADETRSDMDALRAV
jgi:hypothetical protein